MATYPATRRAFLDGETRNQSAALAGLFREIALAQNTSYARDLAITPCDPAVYMANGWVYGETNPWTPTNSFWSSVGTVNVAEIFLPDPRGPFRQVRLWTYWDIANSGYTATATFTNAETGVVTSLAVSYAALGSSLTGWLSVDVTAGALQTIRVAVGSPSAGAVALRGISGYWIQPSLAGVTQVARESRAAAVLSAVDRPYSTLLLRYLARSMNAHWYGRPLQVVAKWLSGYGSGTTSDWLAWARCVGRYKVWVGAKVDRMTVSMRTNASAASSVTVAIAGLSVSSSVAVSSGAGTASVLLSFTAPTLGADHELTITVDGSPGYVEVQTVLVTEAGEDVSPPVNFTANDDDLIVGGSGITEARVTRLLDNERWLWVYRRIRTLVADCRYTPPASAAAFNGLAGVAQLVASHRIVLSRPGISTGDQAAPVQIRQGVHGINDATLGEGALTTYEAGHSAEAAWAPGVSRPYVTGSASTDWGRHARAVWQHRQEHKYTAASEIDLRTFQAVGGGLTHHAWTIVEELPIGTPFLIGAP